MNIRAKKSLEEACKKGQTEYLKKFSIPKNRSSVRAKSERTFHDTQNAIESIGDQIVKQVRESAEHIDWTNPGAIDQMCNEIGACAESCKERFIWAYEKYPKFNGNDKWVKFSTWLNGFRREVRDQLLAVLDEEENGESMKSADISMMDDCLDGESEISKKMAKIMQEQGFNGSLSDDLQGLLLAISAGEQADVEKALRRFLVEAARQSKEELRKKYDTVREEARLLKRQIENMDTAHLDMLKGEIATLKTCITSYDLKQQESQSEMESERERVSGLLDDERNYRMQLEERVVVLVEEIENMRIQLLGAQTSAEKMKADALKLAAYSRETSAINDELLRDLEAIQLTANRRQRRITELLNNLATAEVDKTNLMEAFKRVRKTKRNRSFENKPCSPYEQSRPTITASCEDESDSPSPVSGTRELTGLDRQSGVIGITERSGG